MSVVLKSKIIDSVNMICSRAYQEKRDVLFEYEVYDILNLLKIKTPSSLFVKSISEITPHKLKIFDQQKIVIKAVCKDIVHKRAVAGVKIVYKDIDFIKFTYQGMESQLRAQGYALDGVLLVNYVNYSQELGNEILLGFRESDAFGPVISFSKGGADAEHFAKNFSAPNLILAPINRKWANALLGSTKIYKKYIEEKKKENISQIAEAGIRLSELSTWFSNFFESVSEFVLKEFEINPIVFDVNSRFIALDGFARIAKKNHQKQIPSLYKKKEIRPFFEPKGIVLVGISKTDPDKTGNIILKNLRQIGRKDIYCINQKGGILDFDGETINLYKTIQDIPRRVDLAVIAIPAEHTIPIIKACAQKEIKAIVLISGGFSEAKNDTKIEDSIKVILKKHNMRLIGPNCLGILASGHAKQLGINTFFVPEEKFKLNLSSEHNVAIFSQSGALGLTEMYNLRHAISPKVMVSYGNQLDLDPSDLLNFFENDSEISTMGCYIEGFQWGAGRKFFDCTSKIKKPIIVYKAGRTVEGRKATESHTASIAGEYEIAKAAMKQAGLIVADKMIDHGDLIKTFALLQKYECKGNKIAIVSNAGYEKTDAADNLADLELAKLNQFEIQALKNILPPFVTSESLLDITPMASDELFEKCITIMLESHNVDAILISIVPYAALIHTTDDEMDRKKDNIASLIVKLLARYQKPIVVSINVVSGSDALYNKLGQTLDMGGVPTFFTASRAMACLNAYVRYKLTKETRNVFEWLK